MCDVSNPAIAQAYQDVRKDATGLNWVVLGYENPTTIKVQGTGKGGVAEAVQQLQDDSCNYGFLKVTYQGDDETTRTKFVFFSWAGPKVSALKKGKMSVHKAAVKGIFTDFAVEIHAVTKEELDEKVVLERIKKANY